MCVVKARVLSSDCSADQPMTPLDLQLLVFTVMTLTGVLLGVWYDFNRALRENFRWRGSLGDLQDVALWAGSVLLVLTGLLLSNWGEFRLHIIISLALGIWVYMALASPVLLRWWRWWFGLLRRPISFVAAHLRPPAKPK